MVKCFFLTRQTSHVALLDVLHDENLFPYHLQKEQDLGEDDYPSRNQMSEWYSDVHK